MIEERPRMPDLIDQAQQTVENEIADAIAHARRAQERMPAPDGKCMHCEAEIMDLVDARFCDADCAADWQRVQEAQRRNGRPE